MAPHWTYEGCDAAAALEQGDILQPTEALNALIARIHPHFRNDKYLGYLVATQSCDLVVRRSTPKTPYITVAVIRPLSQVLQKLVECAARPVSPGRFRSSDKGEFKRLLERLVNQNEQGIGLFFLFTDDVARIAEPAVAFLRVTIAFRAEHYDVLREARSGRLTPEFRAKLGWLIGNLYGRPATPDWADHQESDIDRLLRQCVNEINWVDDEIIDEVAAWGFEIGDATNDSLEHLRPPSRLERAISEAQIELLKVEPQFSADSLRKFMNRLRNNGKLKKLLK
jgi:hypothetical protein